jgi:hypothetical protein
MMRWCLIALSLFLLFLYGILLSAHALGEAFDQEKKVSTNEWQQGDFITYRRIHPHQPCGGQLVFNGHSTRAPYSETDVFYDHVCDRCSTTNQILNATWPQFKREWRSK